MLHKLKKLAIYFNATPYWRLASRDNLVVKTKCGPFLLNLVDRLYDHHYDLFDKDGFPIRRKNGQDIYGYTTICSYALAKWQLYLETGETQHATQLIKTVSFLKETATETHYGGLVFETYDKHLSAMNQGEALSVIARAYEFTNDEALKEFAKKVVMSYNVMVKDRGVKGQFGNSNIYWYEERAMLPYKHILNGMIYAVNGLRDIITVMPEIKEAGQYFNDGVNYIAEALPKFDTGSWSLYWYDETHPHYPASMMYHNLHICQLTFLYNVTKQMEFKHYADKFAGYNRSVFKRINAGIALAVGKVKLA